MIVQHNLTAMNSQRMLGLTMSSQAKSTEKLSSGYKINRAADDAAGLSISEKMRRQIRGLTQASLNAQDGISAVQTAEGALTEVHDMLQRMNELAVKAANGTNQSEDQAYIQAEVDQLITEIDRVAQTTTFNERMLLDGSFSAVQLQVGAEGNAANQITMNVEEMSASAIKSVPYPSSVLIWVLFRTVWSIPSTTWITLLRIPLLQRLRSAIRIWRLKWLSTPIITFWHRLVRLCLHRLIRRTRVYWLCFSNSKRRKAVKRSWLRSTPFL